MPQAAQSNDNEPDRGSLFSMADFVKSQGGAEAALRGLDSNDQAASARPQPPTEQLAQSPPSAEPDNAVGDEPELDAATLQALGLVQGDESQPPEDDAEGDTPQKAIDPGSITSALGFDEKDIEVTDKGLRIKTKVDGEETWVSPDELRKGYQLQKHFTRQNDQFLAEKQAWEQLKQQQEQQVSALAGLANQILTSEEEALKAQYTKDWGKLREEDPAEYSAQVAEYNQKLSEIQQRRQGLIQRAQESAQQQYQEKVQQAQQMAVRGLQTLSEAMGWRNEEQQKEGVQNLRSYMQSTIGLQPQEIDSVMDARVLIATEKARLYDELMAKVEDTRKKRVAQTHKTPSGAAAAQKMGGKKRAVQTAMARLAESGTVEDAGRAFLQMGALSMGTKKGN